MVHRSRHCTAPRLKEESKSVPVEEQERYFDSGALGGMVGCVRIWAYSVLTLSMYCRCLKEIIGPFGAEGFGPGSGGRGERR